MRRLLWLPNEAVICRQQPVPVIHVGYRYEAEKTGLESKY